MVCFDREAILGLYDRVYDEACQDFAQRSPVSPDDLIGLAPEVIRTPPYLAGVEDLRRQGYRDTPQPV